MSLCLSLCFLQSDLVLWLAAYNDDMMTTKSATKPRPSATPLHFVVDCVDKRCDVHKLDTNKHAGNRKKNTFVHSVVTGAIAPFSSTKRQQF